MLMNYIYFKYIVADNILNQKANALVKGTTADISWVFFLALNIDVAVSHRFITVE